MKRILKCGVNKRRRKGKYLWLGKLCHYSATATQQGLVKLCDKLAVANRNNHRLLQKQRRGMKQEEKRQNGDQLKRERVVFAPLLDLTAEQLINVANSKHGFELDGEDENLSQH